MRTVVGEYHYDDADLTKCSQNKPGSSYPDFGSRGTREMCRIGQDVGILRFFFSLIEIVWDHTFLSDVTERQKTQVVDYTSSTVHTLYDKNKACKYQYISSP
jgi:hypothetical protein